MIPEKFKPNASVIVSVIVAAIVIAILLYMFSTREVVMSDGTVGVIRRKFKKPALAVSTSQTDTDNTDGE